MDIKNLVSVEVLRPIYENRRRYAKGEKFLIDKGRAFELGSCVRILKELHDPVIKDIIAPNNTMIKTSPVRKIEPVKEKEKVGDAKEPEPVKDIPKKEEFICSICGKIFGSRIALMGHSRSHKKGKGKK